MSGKISIMLPSYMQMRRRPSRRLIALGLIALFHVMALMALMQSRHPERPMPAPTLMVSLITTVAPLEQKPQPPKPRRSAPAKPQVISAPVPAPSAMEAPPMEAPPPEPPPAAPAPPAPAAVIPPNFVAAYLNNPAPSYPAMSVRLREEGTVILLVRVSAEGSVEQIQVEHSSGSARLDEAATMVVKNRWRFVPAKQGDQPVAAWVRIPLSFELKKH